MELFNRICQLFAVLYGVTILLFGYTVYDTGSVEAGRPFLAIAVLSVGIGVSLKVLSDDKPPI